MTIFGLSVESFISLVNWLGITLAGVAAAFAVRHGRKQTPEKPASPGGVTMELSGALVDSSAIKMLTSAVEAKTMESIACRQDAEKTRQDAEKTRLVGGRLVDATSQLTDQVEELRRVMQDMSNQIARSR